MGYNYAVQKLVEEKREVLTYRVRALDNRIRACEGDLEDYRREREEAVRQLAALDEPTAPKTVEITD